MPRTKTTGNPFGTILPKKITLNGRKVIVYDARKRYKDADGKPAQKFKRCYTMAEAQTALLNFPSEIAADLAEKTEEKKKVLTFSS